MLSGENNDVVFKQIDAEENAELFDLWLQKNDREMY
jgi:hypothetical protein